MSQLLQSPITLAGGIILVSVRVNGAPPVPFVLDSGFEETVLDPDQVSALGLSAQDTHQVSAPGGSTEYGTAPDVALSLDGDIDLPARPMGVVPIRKFAPFFGHDVFGVLGYDFLERFVAKIDYDRRLLTLYEPQSYAYSGTGTRLPINLETRQPYVEAGVTVAAESAPVLGRFEIDTGSMDALSMNMPFVEAHHLLSPEQRTLSIRGVSLGGESTGLLTRIDRLQIGNVEIAHPIAGIVTEDVDRAGQISGDILRRFTVIFDYAHKQVILEPNQTFAEPFEWDMAGLMMIAEAPSFATFRVFLVVEGSPAAQAGIQAGDVVTSINGQPAELLNLQELRTLLRQADRRLGLTVRRGDIELETELTLRRLI